MSRGILCIEDWMHCSDMCFVLYQLRILKEVENRKNELDSLSLEHIHERIRNERFF